MLIRATTVADAPSLEPLFDQWGHPLPVPAIEAQLRLWAGAPYAEVLIADVGGTVAGVVAVLATPHLGAPGRHARIVGLVVAGGHRRRGVGARLVHAAEELAIGWDCDRIELTSSRSRDAAHAFYPALGYRDQCDRQARYERDLGPR